MIATESLFIGGDGCWESLSNLSILNNTVKLSFTAVSLSGLAKYQLTLCLSVYANDLGSPSSRNPPSFASSAEVDILAGLWGVPDLTIIKLYNLIITPGQPGENGLEKNFNIRPSHFRWVHLIFFQKCVFNYSLSLSRLGIQMICLMRSAEQGFCKTNW